MLKLRPPGIITITIVALLLRLVLASWAGLATDEANGVMIAVSGDWSDMLLHLKNDGNAPLFYALVKLIDHELGHGDRVVKALAVLLGTITVPFTYVIFRSILPRPVCLQLAWILAFCPALIRYGTLVRPYALVSMISLASSYFCIKILTKDSSRYWILPYGLTTALIVYTHYWGAFIAIGQAGLAVVGSVRRWFGKNEIINWLLGVALALLLFAPQLPTLLYQLQHDMSPWDTVRRPLALIPSFLPGIILDIGARTTFIDQLSTLFTNLLLVTAFAFTARYLYETTWKPKSEAEAEAENKYNLLTQNIVEVETVEKAETIEEFDSRKWKTLAIIGLGACFLVNFILPSMRFRYILPFIPIILIIYLTAADMMLTQRRKIIRYVLPVIPWILLALPQLEVLAIMPETNTGEIVDIIARDADSKKDLVVISWQIIAPAINYYLPRDIESVSFPDLRRSDFNHWPEMQDRVKDSKRLEALFEKMKQTVDEGGRIWLIERARDLTVHKDPEKRLKEDIAFEETFTLRMDQIHSWLKENAEQRGEIRMAPGRDFPIFLTTFVKSNTGIKPELRPQPAP